MTQGKMGGAEQPSTGTSLAVKAMAALFPPSSTPVFDVDLTLEVLKLKRHEGFRSASV